jgi:hypothetical protein
MFGVSLQKYMSFLMFKHAIHIYLISATNLFTSKGAAVRTLVETTCGYNGGSCCKYGGS